MACNTFQWRQSRGGTEKFHGAVIGHVASRNARVSGCQVGLSASGTVVTRYFCLTS